MESDLKHLKQPVKGPTEEFTIENLECICRRCQSPFWAAKFEVLGARLTTNICQRCSDAFELQKKAAAETRQLQTVLRNAKAREEAWIKWCPKEFRLAAEGGGLTVLSRLEVEQPMFQDLMAWDAKKGIIIRGSTGRCKTRSVWRLVRRLFDEGQHVVVLTAGQFDRQCRDAAGTFTLTAWFDRLARADVLVLDDLGNGAWTDSTGANWLDLVDERTRNGRPIIVTTQHTGDSLMESGSDQSRKQLRAEAMIRRLRDYCQTVVFQ
jgi:DNA replication protein DnaC